MSYKINIKNDYKIMDDVSEHISQYRRWGYWAPLGLCSLLLVWFGYATKPGAIIEPDPPASKVAGAHHSGAQQAEPGASARQPTRMKQDLKDTLEKVIIPVNRRESEGSGVTAVMTDNAASNWIDISINKGDSLARIFNRQGLPAQNLHAIMQQGNAVNALRRLQPGQTISLLTETGEIQGLRFDIDPYRRLLVNREGSGFTSEIIKVEPETQVRQAQGVISDSLFLSAQAAGLTDKLIMELIEIYSWDIDFMLEVRNGDRFKVIYESHYKGAKKIADGPVLAAEFVNKGRKIRAVRYQREDGRTAYYDNEGLAMRKAFLRSPIEFSRISSHFNLRRKHPILNRIRAHKGVDYAAPTGTPIRAAGDGRVHYTGNKGGYGRTIILKHGAKYSTLYAHLSRYKKGIRQGKTVKQGQIIGYVGQSGLATGPHLHYEFHVNGRHRNPLTVALPEADGVPQSEMDTFKASTSPLFAMLEATEPANTETRLASIGDGLGNKL